MKVTRYIRRISAGLLKVIALSAVIIIFKAQGASAATYNVAAGNGDINANSSCSLAEAVHNITYTNQDYTECPEGIGGTPTINLPAGTITLSQNLLPLAKPVNIIGKGRDVSIIDGGEITLLFRISMGGASPEIPNDVTIRGFTARNVSRAGGSRCIGITSDWQNEIRKNVTIQDINLENCGQYGIALAAFSSTNIISGVNITSDNTTSTSGMTAIYPDNVSISDSSVSGYPIGVYFAVVSDIPATEFNFEVFNTTTSGNKLGLLAIAETGESDLVQRIVNLDLLNNTISNNISPGSGGISGLLNSSGLIAGASNSAQMNLRMSNNIVAGNTVDGATHNCFFGAGDSEDNVTFNASRNISDDLCTGKLGDGNFTDAANIMSGIGPLQDNGGEITTMALLDGSAALDQGVPLDSVTTDARGISRPQAAGYDIGAYEKMVSSITDPPIIDDTEPSPSVIPLPPRAGVFLGLLVVIIATMSAIGVLSVEQWKKKSSLRKSGK